MHEQPQPTEDEEQQVPERLEEEEPVRNLRTGERKLPGDNPPEEPIHEA